MPQRKHIIIACLAWTLLAALSAGLIISGNYRNMLEQFRATADMAFQKDLTFRRWNSMRGGVYVKVSEDNQPNPYLDVSDRDLRTDTGTLLTMINPAYMTRQAHELQNSSFGIQGHITSLKPIRPGNAPDSWERAALESFERGTPEVTSLFTPEGRVIFRFMRPMITEKSCLKCHAKQGYAEGDIRGGISVTLPVEAQFSAFRDFAVQTAGGHILVWAGGVAVVLLAGIRIVRSTQLERQARQEAENASEKLNESAMRYRALFTAVSDPILVADRDTGILIECNAAAERFFGRSREQLIGLPQRELHPPETPLVQDVTEDFKRKVADPEHSEEIRVVAAGGEIRYVEVVTSSFEIGENRLILRVFRDVTERNKFEKALRESESRFRTILEDVQMVSIQGYDQERRVTYWNKASELLYGFSREEALGRKLEDLIIPDFMRDDVIAHVEHWVLDGVPIPAGHLELRRKDGSIVPVYSSHAMLETTSGSKEMYCIDIDYSEVRATHARLVQARDAAEAANRAKSEFLANMSHEIRTPMNGILGMLQLMETSAVNEEQKEYILNAIKASKRLTRLLSDILDLSRIEAGKMALIEAEFEVQKQKDSVLELFAPAAREKGLDLDFLIDEKVPPALIGDKARLRQILFNLVGNAVKFTEKGWVRIDVSPLDACENQLRVLFTLSDTGVGIPDDRLKDIFEPFVQAEVNYTRHFQGAGLGLSIVRKLVKMMNGTLCLDQTEEGGTTVYLMLPFKLPASVALASKQATPSEELTTADTLRVLIAEDEEVSLLAGQKTLTRLGHEVVIAKDGQAVLNLLLKKDIHLILMDIQMPVMDGVEATKAIRAGEAGVDKAAIPIIAMTGYAMVGDKEKFLAAGMDDYISKPVDMAELNAVIRRVMKKQQSSHAVSPNG